ELQRGGGGRGDESVVDHGEGVAVAADALVAGGQEVFGGGAGVVAVVQEPLPCQSGRGTADRRDGASGVEEDPGGRPERGHALRVLVPPGGAGQQEHRVVGGLELVERDVG